MTEPQDPQDDAHDPVQRSRAGVRSTRTSVAQAVFLTAFASLGNITAACAQSGVGRRTHYDWLQSDADYPALFMDAQNQWMEALEEEATRRAKIGWEEPVFQGGREVGTVRKYSDQLLMFLMKGANPGKYRDNAKGDAEESGNRDGVGLNEKQRQLIMDELDELEKQGK